ncbi:GntR family transcriptional regulator [Telmatospirillum sp.]|uniref:GntR family transcriptional regulator n=1 Tax=Telmatospirillum sp. TaxID=2079197 RepID=UPI00284B78E9|nr:GntR family transcriptional regulator [Telmatospirillum sp.]MDR3438288.1 GntR family transcriptional regulator [Telmatospirillum sp.]
MSAIDRDRRNSRLASQVFTTLREDIVRGVLPPNAPLSELDLCDRLQVSRTPVREALIKLAEEGLVKIYPQFGSFVAPISLEAVAVGQYIREHLECALISDAARRMDADAIRRIQDSMEAQAKAVEDGDAEEFYSLDNKFHAMIAEFGGNPKVWNVISQTKTQFDRVRYLSVQEPGRNGKLLEQHKEIADNLIAGDGVKAKAALRRHLREVFTTVEKLGLTEATNALPPRRRRTAPGAAT